MDTNYTEALERIINNLLVSKASGEEIFSINESIKKYEEEVEKLKEKLSNPDNYAREKGNYETNERPMIEQLLSESIAKQKEDLSTELAKYEQLQTSQKQYLEEYKRSIEQAKNRIDEITYQLEKNEVAIKRGYTKFILSKEEIDALRQEVEQQEKLVELGNSMVDLCNEDIERYNINLSELQQKLNDVKSKEKSLNRIKEMQEQNKELSDIDRNAIRLDQDRLARLEAGVDALKKRKAFLEGNDRVISPEELDEIRALIANISKELEEERSKNNVKDDEIARLKKEVEDKDKEIADLKSKNAELAKENEKLKKENEELRKNQEKKPAKVTKVTKAKEFLKKHKKAILIAGGIAALALMQPVIIPAIMHANSVLWVHAPALRGMLHGCNLALGKLIGASYVGSTGLWTSAAGTIINANAASASLLGALATQTASLGAVGIAAKKLATKIKDKIKRKKKDKIEETPIKEEDTPKIETEIEPEAETELEPEKSDVISTDTEEVAIEDEKREQKKNRLEELRELAKQIEGTHPELKIEEITDNNYDIENGEIIMTDGGKAK